MDAEAEKGIKPSYAVTREVTYEGALLEPSEARGWKGGVMGLEKEGGIFGVRIHSQAPSLGLKFLGGRSCFIFLLFKLPYVPQRHLLFGWNYAPKKNKGGAGSGEEKAAAGGKRGALFPTKAPAPGPAATAAAMASTAGK